jgi:hypothetical protein
MKCVSFFKQFGQKYYLTNIKIKSLKSDEVMDEWQSAYICSNARKHAHIYINVCARALWCAIKRAGTWKGQTEANLVCWKQRTLFLPKLFGA